jgi:glycerophosphoryl diester phosphodiesterase
MPRYVVHRGGAARWPENSMRAFTSAIALGAEILELDVHLTADGEVAVIHDPTLDRTTTGTGPVAARTAAELRAVRLKGPDGTPIDEGVAMLGEVLAVAAPAGVALLVEIKTPGPAVVYERAGPGARAVPGRRYEGLERKVIDALATAGVAERALVMAFNPAVVAQLRALAPALRTALLVDRHHVHGAGVASVAAVEWAQEAGVTFLGLHHALCDGGVVEAARRAGILVGVFTVNDEDDMRRLAALGVDVIITDRPDLATRMRAEAP